MKKNELALYMLKVEEDRNAWFNLPDEVKGYRDVFKIAFVYNHSVWADAPYKAIKCDRKITEFVLRVNGFLLEHCRDIDKKNIELVRIAIKRNPLSILHAHPSLLENRELMIDLAKRNGHVFAIRNNIIPKKWYNDIEMMDIAVNQSPLVFQITSEAYRSDYDRCLKGVQAHYTNYRFVPKSFKIDKTKGVELALAAIEKSIHMLRYIPPQIKKSKEFREASKDFSPLTNYEIDRF